MTLSWPNHVLTLEDREALPENELLRLELVEGVLAVVPQPHSWHRRAGNRLAHRLDDQLPLNLVALAEVDVVIANPVSLYLDALVRR
jgi:hypothetical protein